jgi:serine/threonine protein phosphatase PrpC
MPLIAHAAACTHTGLVRRRNEDAVYVGRWLFAVADGLGGHIAGDTASTTVINTLQHYDRQVDPAELPDVLGRAILEANDALRHKTEMAAELAGMGTTLVAMLWSGTAAALANVGDSRAYQLRDSHLVQITEDHTYGNLVSNAPTVPNLPDRMARFLDGRADGRSPDITVRGLHTGDRFLLCSDGLSSVVPAARVRETMASIDGPDETTARLVSLAIDHGGPDNITVIVLDVRDGDNGHE